jgi:hypothetical protein
MVCASSFVAPGTLKVKPVVSVKLPDVPLTVMGYCPDAVAAGT